MTARLPLTARLIAGALPAPDQPYDADIIILAMERIPDTLAAIASADQQTGIRAHIFVLDQGSGTAGLQALAHAARDRGNVALLVSDRNLGVAAGRNLISNLGHGRVIVALDNDAEFATRDTVARMIAALDAEPRFGAIGCRIVRHADGYDDLSSWGYPASLLPCAGESFDAITYVGAGHAILRRAWQQAGGYDPKLFFCWEEFDFCLRAIALGWRIRYRGDIVIRHKVAAQQRVGWDSARWFYFVRNRLYIARKLDAGWIRLTPRIIGYLLKGVRNGLTIQTLRAIPAAAGMAPRASSTITPRAPPSIAPRASSKTAPQAFSMMPPAALSYLMRNDRAHRGSLLRRLMREVLIPVGVPPNVASTTEQ